MPIKSQANKRSFLNYGEYLQRPRRRLWFGNGLIDKIRDVVALDTNEISMRDQDLLSGALSSYFRTPNFLTQPFGEPRAAVIP
jgi:hypothetical protein